MEIYLEVFACGMVTVFQILKVVAVATVIQGSVYQLSGKRISIWNIYRNFILKEVNK